MKLQIEENDVLSKPIIRGKREDALKTMLGKAD